ncbi:MAG: hypothetical protein OXC37_03500, partial [Bdellovibrionaceae bacterium]|nr:hypothetical protein [Pseudobdellovibrionaceae bacterium]
MKPKFFIQFFISFCVIAVGALAFYEYYQSQKEKQKQEELSLFLPHVNLEELESFQIKKENNQLIAEKKDQKWLLIEPVKDLMSWTEFSRWFDSIKRQKVQKMDSDNLDWKNYYLDSAP